MFDDTYRIIFLNALLKIFCTYSLDSSGQGHSNEYPQCILFSKNMEIILQLLSITHLICFSAISLYQRLRISSDFNNFLRTGK